MGVSVGSPDRSSPKVNRTRQRQSDYGWAGWTVRNPPLLVHPPSGLATSFMFACACRSKCCGKAPLRDNPQLGFYVSTNIAWSHLVIIRHGVRKQRPNDCDRKPINAYATVVGSVLHVTVNACTRSKMSTDPSTRTPALQRRSFRPVCLPQRSSLLTVFTYVSHHQTRKRHYVSQISSACGYATGMGLLVLLDRSGSVSSTIARQVSGFEIRVRRAEPETAEIDDSHGAAR